MSNFQKRSERSDYNSTNVISQVTELNWSKWTLHSNFQFFLNVSIFSNFSNFFEFSKLDLLYLVKCNCAASLHSQSLKVFWTSTYFKIFTIMIEWHEESNSTKIRKLCIKSSSKSWIWLYWNPHDGKFSWHWHFDFCT